MQDADPVDKTAEVPGKPKKPTCGLGQRDAVVV
jgi:hypothetical protein